MLDIIRAAVRKALFQNESERDERWVKTIIKVKWNGFVFKILAKAVVYFIVDFLRWVIS